MSQLWTLAEIAGRFGVPPHRVRYAIESRSIQPAGKLGNVLVFGPAEVDRVAAALAEIDDARAGQVTAVACPTLLS